MSINKIPKVPSLILPAQSILSQSRERQRAQLLLERGKGCFHTSKQTSSKAGHDLLPPLIKTHHTLPNLPIVSLTLFKSHAAFLPGTLAAELGAPAKTAFDSGYACIEAGGESWRGMEIERG